MNCSHCKAQWTPPPNKSVSTCPFCGKPLVDPADVSVDTKPEVILRQVVERFDMAILGERRLSAILKDLMPHVERKYLRIFTQAINDGIGEKLLSLTNETSEVRTATLHTLKDSFRQHNGYDQTSNYVVDCFLYALGWVNKVDEQQTEQGVNNLSLMQQQIEIAFADKVLSKDEANLLFQTANILGIDEVMVVEAIEQKIKAFDLKPKTAVSKIKNRKENICSTNWEGSEKINLKSVKIGNQIWMTENLNVAHFRNGDPIPEAKSDEEWIQAGKNGKPAWCYYDNDPENGLKFGKIYNWFALNDKRGIAPKGFKVTSHEDWCELRDFLGGSDLSGKILKSKSSWNNNGNGSDDFGFNALPAGKRNTEGVFESKGFFINFWTTRNASSTLALDIQLNFDNDHLYGLPSDKRYGYYVRCVKSSKPVTIKKVIIGNQIWMAKNLNVNKFLNGDPILEAKTKEEWQDAGKKGIPAWCYYDNNPENSKKYGKLYNWYAVNDPRELAPSGWKIPCEGDWIVLSDFIGDIEATMLKTGVGWYDSGNGSNQYGFSARPGGCRYASGAFYLVGYSGIWWCANEINTHNAGNIKISYNETHIIRGHSPKKYGFSVRCIKV